MRLFRSLVKRTDSFAFAIGTILILYGVVAIHDSIFPSIPDPVVLTRDDGYSDYTVAQIVCLHKGLWEAHCQTEREMALLAKESEGDFFIKEFKWKGAKAFVTIGVPKDAAFAEVQLLWPHRVLVLKKIEKKKTLHYIQIEFSIPPFLLEYEECPTFTGKNKENLCELAELVDIVLDTWSYDIPPKALKASCDRVGKVSFRGTMEQRANFLVDLAQQGWILGRTGRCYAKADGLVFDFELLHLCRPSDASA
jgi:hypothetical protein